MPCNVEAMITCGTGTWEGRRDEGMEGRKKGRGQRRDKERGRREKRTAKTAREHCHKHFWKFARELLDDIAASKVTPEFL